jgi:gas vesicle protein
MRHDEFDDEPTVVIEQQSASLGAFLVGLAVGAGAALLFAPRSGDETRADIARRARDAGDRARGLADDLNDRVNDQVGRARGAVNAQVDRARSAVDLKKHQVQRAMEAGRVAAQQAREDLERRIAETRAAYQAGAEQTREVGRAAVRGARDVARESRLAAGGGAASAADGSVTPDPLVAPDLGAAAEG